MEAAKPNLKLLLALLTPAGAALKAGMVKAGTELIAPRERESTPPRLLPNAGSVTENLKAGDEQLLVPAPKAKADEAPNAGAADGPHVEVEAPNADAAGATRTAGAKSKHPGSLGTPKAKAGNVAAPNSAAPDDR